MEETVHTNSVDDDPICVCGYSKSGLPENDHPCPECGSTKLAVYQSSFSYYGWVMAFAGELISFVHSDDLVGLAAPKEMDFRWFYKGLASAGGCLATKRNGFPLVLQGSGQFAKIVETPKPCFTNGFPFLLAFESEL